MSLCVENLCVSRDGRPILQDLSFQADAGRALILRGPNGVGKSTLLRALAGLVPCAGQVRLGQVSLRDADQWAEQLAYAGHLDAIKPQLSVAENLRFWAGIMGGDADAALHAFALEPLADRLAAICSAGQKRRLGLARLALRARAVWLLDEPSVALDRAATALLAGQIDAHCAQGGIAVIATHVDLPLAASSTLTLHPLFSAPQGASQDPFLAEAFQ